ncbi:MAG TPA: lysophospholipid acyltransferase family protein [Blastocatellia bacterium]|jgi:1-acyl-sn-glycerol-3-phosphate acyltransferase|nr:lysophospholipid acyltransferase family protein [Blastocatellia bacterium]
MRYTIFDTPVISPLIRGMALSFLKAFGWRLEGRLPDVDKLVVIVAPHTSNWDFLILISLAFGLGAKASWLGKHTLFRRPFGFLSRWMCGVPVYRSASQNLVAQSVETFRNSEKLILTIPPEGTRGKVSHWKTGFYYIALGAGTPIAMGFIDYKRKVVGVGPTLYPTGDIGADMEIIRNFYVNVTAKYPEHACIPALAQD